MVQIAPKHAAAPASSGANPDTPGYPWVYLDSAVDRVGAAGMSVTLTITGPGAGVEELARPAARRPA